MSHAKPEGFEGRSRRRYRAATVVVVAILLACAVPAFATKYQYDYTNATATVQSPSVSLQTGTSGSSSLSSVAADAASASATAGLTFYETANVQPCSSPSVNTGLTAPSGTGSAPIAGGQTLCLWTPAYGPSTPIYGGTSVLDLWGSSSPTMYLGNTVEGSCPGGKCENLATSTGAADTTTSQSLSSISTVSQETYADSTTTTTTASKAFTATPTAGDLLVMAIGLYSGFTTVSGFAVTAASCSTTWTLAQAGTSTTRDEQYIYYCSSASGSTATIATSWTGAARYTMDIYDLKFFTSTGFTCQSMTSSGGTTGTALALTTSLSFSGSPLLVAIYSWGGTSTITDTATFTTGDLATGAYYAHGEYATSGITSPTTMSATLGTTETYRGGVGCQFPASSSSVPYKIEPDVASSTATGTPSTSTPSGYAWESSSDMGGTTITSGTWQFDLTVRATSIAGTPVGHVWITAWNCQTISLGTCTKLFKNWDNSTNVLASTTATKYTYTTSSETQFTGMHFLAIEYWLVLTMSSAATTATETTVSSASDVIPPPPALTVSAYTTTSTGGSPSPLLSSGATAAIPTSETEMKTSYSTGGGTVPAGGYIEVSLTTGLPVTVYWGSGQTTNFQTPNTYNYVLAISNSATVTWNVNLATQSSMTTNLASRVLSTTISFVSPASNQIVVSAGTITQAAGSAQTLPAYSGSPGVIDIEVVATATTVPTASNAPSTITFSIVLASTSSTAFSQYTVTLTVY